MRRRGGVSIALAVASVAICAPAVQAQTEYQLKITISGLSSLVFDEDSDGGLTILYPNLADTAWLPDSFQLETGEVAYHQLRIFFSKEPKFLPSRLAISRAFPCHEADKRWPMINVSEALPFRHFQLDFKGTGTNMTNDVELPVLNRLARSANWPRGRRRVRPNYMEDDVPLEWARRLTGRVRIPRVTRDEFQVNPFAGEFMLYRSLVKMPRDLVWRGRLTEPEVELCYRKLSDSRIECIGWKLGAEGLHLHFEHHPPHVQGHGCRSGEKDFIGHYALLEGVRSLPAFPLPLDYEKKGEPGFADDAMCSPVEVKR